MKLLRSLDDACLERTPEGAPLPVGFSSDVARVSWGGDVHLVVRSGTRLTLHASTDVDTETLRLMVLGPGAAALWTQQGGIVLHGSSATIDGVTLAFVAPSGEGKSTLAAQLHRHGHPFLSDGMVATVVHDGSPWVHPGVPYFKLDDQSLRAVGLEPDSLTPVHTTIPKRYWQPAPSRPVRSVPSSLNFEDAVGSPLAGVCVLETGERPSLEPIRGGEALHAIFQNMYLLPFVEANSGAYFLKQAAEIARHLPVWRLRRPRGFEHVPSVIDLIERHARSLVPARDRCG